MLIKALRNYRGAPTNEQLLERGRVYQLPHALGQYLLTTFPDAFQAVEPRQVSRREIVRLDLPPQIKGELPAALAEVAGDAMALRRVLQSSLRREEERLARLRRELKKAQADHAKLASMTASGEATARDKERLKAARQRVGELAAEVREVEIGIGGLQKRIGEVERQIGEQRLQAYQQQFDLQMKEYTERFASLCELAVRLVDEAEALYSLRRALEKLSGWVEREAATLAVPVDRRYLDVSTLPKPADVKLDRFLKARAGERGKQIRQAVGRFTRG